MSLIYSLNTQLNLSYLVMTDLNLSHWSGTLLHEHQEISMLVFAVYMYDYFALPYITFSFVLNVLMHLEFYHDVTSKLSKLLFLCFFRWILLVICGRNYTSVPFSMPLPGRSLWLLLFCVVYLLDSTLPPKSLDMTWKRKWSNVSYREL